MPVAVKDIYAATNLADLRQKNAVDFGKWKNKPSLKLAEAAKKLYEAAKSKMKDVEPDEEMTYVFLFRAMELWQMIRKTQDYNSDKKYYELMYGKDMNDVIHLLEEYTVKLQKRYAALESGSNRQSIDSLKQFTLTANVMPKKRKEGKDSSSDKISNISNGLKSPLIVDQKCLDEYALIMNTDVSKPTTDYVENKFIECEVFKELIDPNRFILIIDVRPKEDYEESKITTVHSVNIPGPSITAGLSANKLGQLISQPREKGYWGQRDQYEQVVLLDWWSEEKDVKPGTPLNNLYVILTEWDPDCLYKDNPKILDGGFERFLDMYPTLTTNPKIKCPEKPMSSSFIHLSDHNIEYPMNILEEEKLEVSSKTVSKAADSSIGTTNSKPSFDRSTKPLTVFEKTDRSDYTLSTTKPSERSVSTAGQASYITDEKMEEEKVTPPRPTQNSQAPSEASRLKERKPDKTVSHVPSNVIPPRPATPPRSERPKVTASNKVNTVTGDGDGEIYLERTKFNTPNRPGGGLKRSASSPNINKLGDEELDKSSTGTPMFDRSIKPKSSFESRVTGTDTVYMADSNKKGRGLTGLKNLGNLCYMNSIMQCISHTEELTKELTKFNINECRNGRHIASEVSSLLRVLWQGDTRITSCRNLKNRVGALRHSFSTMEQQDSHEFLTILVDWLHEDLNEPSNIRSLEGAAVATGEKAWGEFRLKNNSLVLDLFYGQLKSTVTCDYCGTESVLFEPFSNLSIPLPSGPDDKDRTFTLQECLKLYLKGESILGWTCPNCKMARRATKKLDITRLPPVLIIHLKRFMTDMVGVGWCRKRMNMVDFPINDLDMKPFTHPESELRFHNYNLYAVSNHYGSMESGHYTAYCKNHALNKWYKFDDQDVNEISPSEVKSSAAYILFYESSQYGNHSSRISQFDSPSSRILD